MLFFDLKVKICRLLRGKQEHKSQQGALATDVARNLPRGKRSGFLPFTIMLGFSWRIFLWWNRGGS